MVSHKWINIYKLAKPELIINSIHRFDSKEDAQFHGEQMVKQGKVMALIDTVALPTCDEEINFETV